MQIQCPSCNARVSLSGEREGAKVRCSECGRVTVARPPDARSAPARRASGLVIAAFAGVVVLIALAFLLRRDAAERARPDGPRGAHEQPLEASTDARTPSEAGTER